MNEQINPPFDGSAPCPMCPQEIRGASAYAHNMLNRWRVGETLPEPKFWIKLDDLRNCTLGEPGYADPSKESRRLELVQAAHPAVRAHLDAILALVVEYAKHPRPTNNTTAQPIADRLAPLVDEIRKTIKPVNMLSEAHFDDNRHCQGTENIIREQRGYSDERGGNYNWFVETNTGGGDFRHKVCGTWLVLHSHFKERIHKDPTFYAKIWCPKCAMNLPEAQFECRVV